MGEFKFDKALIFKLLAEFMGTAMILTLGCCVQMSQKNGTVASIGWGLAYLTAIHTFSFISGAHFNPAVSATATLIKAMDWKLMLCYMLVQLLGAFAGFGVAYGAAPLDTAKICLNITGRDEIKMMVVEWIMMMVFLFAYCGIWDQRSEGAYDTYSVRIGFIFAALSCAAIGYTGGHLNFFRSLAPAICQLEFGYLWPFLVGQVLAVLVVGLLWRYLLGEGEPEKIE